ncbi:MAG: DUF423 domain-containing protein [Sphingomonadales bacterium]|jgi:uncharacterized membrane protein YgdD (TMEM256/DUF423 family)
MPIKITTNLWIFIAAANGFLAVGASAFGAHVLEGLKEGGLILFNQGASFQMSHALALLGVGIFANFTAPSTTKFLHYAGVSFQLGVVFFSGSLYWLGIKGPGSLGHLHFLPPVGGLCLLVGWGLLTYTSWKTIWGRG